MSGSILGMAEDVVSVAEFTAFRDRVVALRQAFAEMPRGSQQSAAHDVRISPSRVSGVLNARYYDIPALEALELWVQEAKPTAPVAVATA